MVVVVAAVVAATAMNKWLGRSADARATRARPRGRGFDASTFFYLSVLFSLSFIALGAVVRSTKRIEFL